MSENKEIENKEIEIKIAKVKKPRSEKQLAHTARLVAMNKEKAEKRKQAKIDEKKVIIKEIPQQQENEKIYRRNIKEMEKQKKEKKLKKAKKVKIPTPPPSPPSSESESDLSSDSSIDSQDYECPPLSDDEPTPVPDFPENYHTDEPEPEPEPVPEPKKRKRKIYR